MLYCTVYYSDRGWPDGTGPREACFYICFDAEFSARCDVLRYIFEEWNCMNHLQVQNKTANSLPDTKDP